MALVFIRALMSPALVGLLVGGGTFGLFVVTTAVVGRSLEAKTPPVEPSQVKPINLQQPQVQPLAASDYESLLKTKGKAMTVVNFWASWCGPCVEEFPELLAFRADEDIKKDTVFHFVSTDFESDMPDVLKFLKSQKVDFVTYRKIGPDQIFLDEVNKKWPAFLERIKKKSAKRKGSRAKFQGALPTTYIYDARGEILERFDGPVTKKQLKEAIQRFRKEKS